MTNIASDVIAIIAKKVRADHPKIEMSDRLQDLGLESLDAVGWSSQSIEAQAFAYLAVRTLNNLPITFPQTTGAPKPMAGGVIARP